jgi:pilus assembly protein Flp/PilA
MIQQHQYFVAWLQTKFGIELAELSAERQEGQGLVEYALILVLVSLACVVALGLLGTKISGVFTTITGKLG